MSDPFSLVTGVLSVVSLVLQVAPRAMGVVDKTVTAHDTQRRVVRNLRRELDKTIKGTTSMQIVLNTMLGNPRDKIVKRMCRKYVVFEVAPLAPNELTSTEQYRMHHLTTAADEGTGGYPRMGRAMGQQ